MRTARFIQTLIGATGVALTVLWWVVSDLHVFDALQVLTIALGVVGAFTASRRSIAFFSYLAVIASAAVAILVTHVEIEPYLDVAYLIYEGPFLVGAAIFMLTLDRRPSGHE